MRDLTLILTDGSEVSITQHPEISVSVHNERYARVHIEVKGIQDDCVTNEDNYFPVDMS
jgi:hypothetical protein